jgi:hypothetical protein
MKVGFIKRKYQLECDGIRPVYLGYNGFRLIADHNSVQRIQEHVRQYRMGRALKGTICL